jgi:hypothetical protein
MKWLIITIFTLLLGLIVYQGIRSHLEVSKIRRKDSVTVTASGDNTLESLRDVLRSSFDYDGYRTLVSQVNVYVENKAQEKPRGLTDERDVLIKHYLLDDSELAELNRTTFTPLDAHYLDRCFLLRDAMNSLGAEQLPPQDRAAAGFAWTMRQVRLGEGAGDLLPPDFVLRRGWGTAPERALVFLAVLEQLGLPGCLIVFPGPAPGQAGSRFWVGALVDKDICLFDTRLGLALPGSGGKGPATLAQFRTNPKLLERLNADKSNGYDVHADDLSKADVQVAGSLSALAPRMRYLQDALATMESIRLAVPAVETFKQFQAAAGAPVHVWNQPGSWNTPYRVDRYFLPVEEGGVDKRDRRGATALALVPLSQYPPELGRRFSPGADPGDRLLNLFGQPFIAFHSQARLPRGLAQAWLPGLFEPKPGGSGRGQHGLEREEKTRGAELFEHERAPRDLVLRGRFEEATALLVAIRGELQHQRELVQKEADLDRQVAGWCERARELYAAFFRAQGSRRRGAQAPAPDAVKEIQELWRPEQVRAVVLRIEGAAAEPMSRDVTYLLALSKQEQAERAQARLDLLQRAGSKMPPAADSKAAESAWRSAAYWWGVLLDDAGAAEYHAAARLFLARCRQALGEAGQARSLLTDLSGKLTPLEKTARLYLARDLPSR